MKPFIIKILLLPVLGCLVLCSGAESAALARQSPAVAGGDSTRLPLVLKTSGRLSTGTLLARMHLDVRRPVVPASLAALSHNLLAALQAEGFYLARIDTLERRSTPAPHVYVRLAEGRRLSLAAVHIFVPDSVPRLRSLRALEKARTPQAVRSRIAALLQELGDKGNAFAAVTIDSVRLQDVRGRRSGYGLFLHLAPGPLVIIRRIEIAGNRVTRATVIRRELPVRPGDVFSESAVAEIPEQLMRLGYFQRVEVPELFVQSAGTAVLRIRVKEGGVNSFNGIVGYNPGTAGPEQSGFVAGLADVKLGNLFGTGRQLAARWEKRGVETQELALRYREPWLFGIPLHLEGGFQQLIQDTLYVERKVDLRAEWRILPRMHVVGRLESAKISPDSASTGAVPGSSSLATGLGLRYDATDDPVNPSSGAFFSTLLESIDRNLSPAGSQDRSMKTRLKRLVVDAGWHQRLWGFQVLSIGLHWRQLTGGDGLNAFTDVFRFGGATSLRGYREEQFSGSRIAWMNFEYRYLLSRRSRAFLFLDLGYFSREFDGVFRENYKHGYGFGARIDTRLGIVGIDYGLGEGDGIMQGKIHVSLVNRF